MKAPKRFQIFSLESQSKEIKPAELGVLSFPALIRTPPRMPRMRPIDFSISHSETMGYMSELEMVKVSDDPILPNENSSAKIRMKSQKTEPGREPASAPTPEEAQNTPLGMRGHQQLWFAAACLLCASLGAAYLATVSILGGAIAGCGPGSGCNQVLSSRWAYWLGLPVSVPAFVTYLTLLVLVIHLIREPAVQSGRRKWMAVVAFSALILAAALWFVLLQMFVVKAWCKFCLATHLSAAAAAAVLIIRSLSLTGDFGAASIGESFCFRNWLIAIFLGVPALALLVAGQSLVRKKLFAVNVFSELTNPGSNLVRLHGRKFKLDPAELPTLESVPATNHLVSLFDYTCNHCRALHPLLKEALQKYRGQLGIVALPVPLDAACNPMILITAPPNKNACEYARLSLAVWHVQHEPFVEFDDWLFASPKPPPLAEARLKAEELVGRETLAQALKSQWVERQIQVDVSLYQANARAVGDGRLPQLNIGDAIAHGAIESQDDLFRLIEKHLHISSTPAPERR
jgi:uncharacterized membrane protein/protein-disulfide isomerase